MYIAGKYINYLYVRAIETDGNASHCIIFLARLATTMYVYCVYPAMSKNPNQLPNFNEQSRNKHRSNHFQECRL